MSAANLDETAMTSSSSVATSDVNKVLRLGCPKDDSRYFGFPWKKRDSRGIEGSRIYDSDVLPMDSMSNANDSNGFFRNIKKRLRIKNLSLCKAKQKIIAIDAQPDNVDKQIKDEKSISIADEANLILSNERLMGADMEISLSNGIEVLDRNSVLDVACGNDGLSETRGEQDDTLPPENSRISELSSAEGNIENGETADDAASTSLAIPPPLPTRNIEAQLIPATVNLSEELLKLSKYGWYWGPISGDEADSKLVSEPDGAFLVRDSSDDRYLLTLSFKSSGRLLHARMEHSGGLFSLCNQGDNKGFTSVAALIDHSMNSSQSAIFCYSRPKYPGYPSFPVRLTKPVSRFTQVRTLQYLCRFVIRQNTRLDNIHKLPLPKTIRGYIEEAHY